MDDRGESERDLQEREQLVRQVHGQGPDFWSRLMAWRCANCGLPAWLTCGNCYMRPGHERRGLAD